MLVVADHAVRLPRPQPVVADQIERGLAAERRNSGLSKPIGELAGPVRPGRLTKRCVERVATGKPACVAGKAGIASQPLCPRHPAQRLPFGVVCHGDADPLAVRARVAAVRGHFGVEVALGLGDHAGHAPREQAVTDQAGHRLHRRQVDELALSCRLAVVERGDTGERSQRAGCRIAIALVHAGRRLALVADQIGEPRQRRKAWRVAGLVAERPVVAPHLDRALDDVGLDLAQFLITKPGALHRAGADVVDDDIGIRDQPPQQRQPLTLLGVELDREHFLVDRQEIGRAIDIDPAIGAHLVKVRAAFNLDHFRTEMGEQLARVRPGPDLGHLDHPHAGKRPAAIRHHPASPWSAPSPGPACLIRTGVALIR